MIDLYFWPTPNGKKITIACEEMGLAYKIVPVDIGSGAQFDPAFLAISPNNRMPAIVDTDAGKLAIFESGAILQYLAEKSGKLMPKDVKGKYDVLQWLAWQIAGLGPMSGQRGHFSNYAPEKIPYAIKRYEDELHRLYGVMNTRLADRPFLAGEYSIADVASYPWVAAVESRGPGESANEPSERLREFKHLTRWVDAIGARPAVVKAWPVGDDLRKKQGIDDAAKKILFGQRAR